jgi:Tfp pilus assembly protein PilO
MNKSLKRTRILGIAFIILFVGITWVFLLGPRLSEPQRLQQVAEEALAQKLALEAQVATLERRERFLGEAERAASELESRFPWQPDVPDLIQQVQDAAGRAGMAPSQVVSVIPGKPVFDGISVPGGGASDSQASQSPESEGAGNQGGEGGAAALPPVAIMDVAISAFGTYEQMSEFLRQLRLSNRVIVVQKVALRASSREIGVAQYEVTIGAHAVLLPQPPSLPGQTSDAAPTTPEGGDVQNGDEATAPEDETISSAASP